MPNGNQESTSDRASESQPTEETLVECAKLLATDAMDWPQNLSDEQQAELVALVRKFRRARLVKLIASQIAADIACEREAKQKRS
jgi:predicted AAA+ superfamily ATPase